jgi:hypothetical protein
MKKIGVSLVLVVIISDLSITVDVYAQSEESQALIDQFQFVERHRARTGYATREHREIGKLARTIGKNKGIAPQVRVEVLTTILAKEIEDPYSLHLIPCGYVPFSEYLKRQYIFFPALRLCAFALNLCISVSHVYLIMYRLNLSASQFEKMLARIVNLNYN